ncbi:MULTISPECIES: hypothetical protein [unclassified Streptomyces]|uniref:hypothetical protein n=1 Tax=unclassified Streptomyces TaxID=2593676 RepID=UPI00364CD3EC
MSVRQQANADLQRVKCKVAYRANRLRRAVAARLVEAGLGEGYATGVGMLAERAFKEGSAGVPGWR